MDFHVQRRGFQLGKTEGSVKLGVDIVDVGADLVREIQNFFRLAIERVEQCLHCPHHSGGGPAALDCEQASLHDLFEAVVVQGISQGGALFHYCGLRAIEAIHVLPVRGLLLLKTRQQQFSKIAVLAGERRHFLQFLFATGQLGHHALQRSFKHVAQFH